MKLRTFFTNISLVVFGLLVALVLGEVVARIYLAPQQSVQVADYQPIVVEKKEVEVREQEHGIDAVLNWGGAHGVRLVPNVKGRIKDHGLSHQDVEIVTNSMGIRYPEFGSKVDGEYRVLIVGDSITFGDYVAASETYPSYLETIATEKGRKIRFINAGLPGANTEDEYYHYLELEQAVKPDLVVVAMYLNDAQSPDRPFYATRIPSPINKSRLLTWLANRFSILKAMLWQELTVEGQAAKEWREDFRAGRELMSGDMFNNRDAFDYEIYNAAVDFGLAWNPKSWERLTYLSDIFSRSVAERGQKFAMFLLPIHIQVMGTVGDTFPQDRFAKLCSSLGLTCLDTLPGLRAVWSESNQPMFYDHCHLNAMANQKLANILYPWLEQERLLEPSTR